MMNPFIPFSAASNLSDEINDECHAVERVLAHRPHPVVGLLHWVGRHLHVPHRQQPIYR